MTVQQSPTPGAAGRDLIASGAQTFTSLQREVDRLFDDFGRGIGRLVGTSFPKLDVVETPDRIEVSAELPGLEEKDVNVELANGLLTISGEKKTRTEEKDGDYWFSERTYGSFLRRIAMPAGLEPQDVKAEMSKGVLRVTVKKPAPAKSAKIEIKPAT